MGQLGTGPTRGRRELDRAPREKERAHWAGSAHVGKNWGEEAVAWEGKNGELGYEGRKGERGEEFSFLSFSISFLISNPNSNKNGKF